MSQDGNNGSSADEWERRSTRTLRWLLIVTVGVIVVGVAFVVIQNGTGSDSDAAATDPERVSDTSFFSPTYDDGRVIPEQQSNGIWSYDDHRGYGGVMAINPLDTGWPNDIDWSEIEEENQEMLSCWAPTRDEAVSIAADGVEFGEGFDFNESHGFGEERPRVDPEPHCELVPVF